MKALLLTLSLIPMSTVSAWADPAAAAAATPAAESSCTLEVEVSDVIGPATVDLLKRAGRKSAADHCGSILLLVNTPGGSLESTRLIVEMILNSPVPYLCLVAPSGGHAGSAGAIILQACHVNGGLHGTNLGAATPVAMGQEMPKDLRRKILNDTRSWMESLTGLRGRDKKFGEDIILEAKAVTSEQALKLGAIDFVGDDKESFLKFAEGREVKIAGNRSAGVEVGPLERFELDTRYTVLSLLTDPELAYMLLLASLALLYFEATHAGMVLPGVAGALGLVVAMVSLHKLDVEWGGLLLILLGVGLMIAEMFLPSFGIVGVGGLVALGLGSIFLFDPVRSWGYHLPYSIVIPTIVVFALLLFGISTLWIRTRGLRKKGGFDDLLGQRARVLSLDEGTKRRGKIDLGGEVWSFVSDADVGVGESVIVKGNSGLVLHVDKEA
jgi:membrane-bound serine protease (ClpP class)